MPSGIGSAASRTSMRSNWRLATLKGRSSQSSGRYECRPYQLKPALVGGLFVSYDRKNMAEKPQKPASPSGSGKARSDTALREEETLKFWQENDVFNKSVDR